MTLYAFDDIDDAIAATRAFLWPFDLRQWLKLAVVVFFMGGVGGFNPFGFSSGTPPGGGPGPTAPDGFPALGGPELAVIGLVLGIVVLIGLLFLLVGSIMEFVFVESLRNEVVAVRKYWGRRWRQGARLFGFRLALGIVSIVVIGGLLLALFLPLLTGTGGFSVGLFLLAIPVFVVVAILGGLVHGLTTVFVVPVMIAEDLGLIAAWRRFWPTMTGQWKQYATYAIMGFVLQLAAGLVSTIAILVLAIVLAIPFAIVGLVGAGLLSASSLAGWVLIGLAVAIYGLLVLLVFLVVSVPIQAFLRYYALLVLGDTNVAFDLIPGRRRVIREGGESPSGAAG